MALMQPAGLFVCLFSLAFVIAVLMYYSFFSFICFRLFVAFAVGNPPVSTVPLQPLPRPAHPDLGPRIPLSALDFSDAQQIGSGAFGTVVRGISLIFLCTQHNNVAKCKGRDVAVKVLTRATFSLDELNGLMHEAEIMKMTIHPNIVRILFTLFFGDKNTRFCSWACVLKTLEKFT